MAFLEACADGVPWRPYGHLPTRQSRLRPTVKESKITEPPQICTATPTTANQRTTPAHRRTEFPGCQRAALAPNRQGLTGRAMTGDAGEIG